MKINNPRFVTSAYNSEDYPYHPKPEFAFAGKSNVGKSSLINKLLNRKKLARTSSQPGRTQSINFYNIDDRFYFVDLPGYGFARVPDKVREEWGELIDDYLYNRKNLKGIIQIVDVRHKPTEEDCMMVDWLLAADFSTMIVATKVDKISRGKRKKQQQMIMETLKLPSDIDFTFFSAKTGEGKKQISGFIMNHI